MQLKEKIRRAEKGIREYAEKNDIKEAGEPMDRKQETKAVKQALEAAGYDVISVKHGTGTAWGWLTIKVNIKWGEEEKERDIYRIIKDRTGRTGEYNGNVTVMPCLE